MTRSTSRTPNPKSKSSRCDKDLNPDVDLVPADAFDDARSRHASRTPGGTATSSGQDISAMLAAFKAEVTSNTDKALKSTASELRSQVLGGVEKMVTQLDIKTERRFERNEAQLEDVDKRLKALEQARSRADSTIEEVRSQVAAADREPTKVMINEMEFERPTMQQVILIRAHDMVEKDEVLKGIENILTGMSLTFEHVVMNGPKLGKRFNATFKGGPDTGARRAAKFLLLLRIGGGWLKLSATMPAGGETALYISEDKNGKTEMRERLTKRLSKTIGEKMPDLEPFARKKVGEVAVNFVGISKVIVNSSEDFDIKWNIVLAEKQGIDKAKRDEIEASTRERRQAGPEVLWG